MNQREHVQPNIANAQNIRADEMTGEIQPNPPAVDSGESISISQPRRNEMTADEQMALYEKELKENDWGHQPC